MMQTDPCVVYRARQTFIHPQNITVICRTLSLRWHVNLEDGEKVWGGGQEFPRQTAACYEGKSALASL